MKLFKSKSVVKVWALSYACMLLIVILTNTYIIDSTNSYVSKEIERTNGYYLKNINITIDGMFSEIDAVVNETSKAGGAERFSKYSKMDESARYDAASLVDELSEMLARHKTFSEIICYFPGSDTVVTPEMFSESETYCKLRAEDNAQWSGEIMRKTRNFANKTVTNVGGSRVDVFEITVPQTDANGNLQYIIRFYVNRNGFLPFIADNSAVVILNAQGGQLLSTDGGQYDFTDVLFMPENAYKLRTIERDGKRLYATYFYSISYRYKYMYVTPDNYFSGSKTRILVLGIVSNLACVLCMFAIMLGMSNWNYKKIKHVLGDDEENTESDADEYERIKRRLDSTAEKSSVLEQRLENQFTLVRDSFLASYINGNSEYKDISRYMQLYNIEPKYDYFFVVSICIRKYGVLEDTPKKYVAFVVNNIMQDIADTERYIYTNIDAEPVFILNCRTDSAEEKSEWVGIFKKLNRLCGQFLEISLTAGASSMGKGFSQIPTLYREALAAREYAAFYAPDEFADYTALRHTEPHIAEVDTKRTNELMAFVQNGDAESALGVIRDIFDAEQGKEKWYYIGFMYSILSNLSAYARRKSEDLYNRIISDMKTINEGASLDEIRGFLSDIIEPVCEISQTGDDSLCARVRAYVDEHYTDPNLNAAAVGEAFGKGGFYISKAFKDYFGQKLGDYIADVRLENAKRLLVEDKSMKINEIAECCGYEVARTFMKQFKDKEGVTPTQYRKMHG